MEYISDDEYSQMIANSERNEREKLEVEVKKLRFELNNLKREVKALKNNFLKKNKKIECPHCKSNSISDTMRVITTIPSYSVYYCNNCNKEFKVYNNDKINLKGN